MIQTFCEATLTMCEKTNVRQQSQTVKNQFSSEGKGQHVKYSNILRGPNSQQPIGIFIPVPKKPNDIIHRYG